MLIHFTTADIYTPSIPVNGGFYPAIYKELSGLPAGLVDISGAIEITSENPFPVGVGRAIETGTGIWLMAPMVEDVVQTVQHHMVIPYYGTLDFAGGNLNLSFIIYGQCTNAAQPLVVNYADLYVKILKAA